jgi:hypothetical protein
MRWLATAATKTDRSGDLIRINPAAPVRHCNQHHRAGLETPFASRRRLRVRLFGYVAQAFDPIVCAFHRGVLARDNIA